MSLVPFLDRSKLGNGRFDDSVLTTISVLTWGQMAKCAVRSMLVVIAAPCLDPSPGVVQRNELIGVQTFIA